MIHDAKNDIITHNSKNDMWFTSSLLFKSKHRPTASGDPLWEERIILLEAESELVAKRKAVQCGKAEEHQYKNQKGELVHWSFEGVGRLCQVDQAVLKDGT